MSALLTEQKTITSVKLRTGAWYGDYDIKLPIFPGWEIEIQEPQTPPPLTDQQIVNILDQPVGQGSFREICKGKKRPLIIVDDLNRPTPVDRVMPHLLTILANAGISTGDISIIMATGSHGEPGPNALLKKVGPAAASSCRLIVHNCFRDVKKIGKTSFGTPVFMNKAVLESDLVLGIGGIYPNNTAGFGGGTKLALGILGIRSIYYLHFRHKMAGWGGGRVHNSFRDDLNEIAEMIGMKTTISMLINAGRDIVQLYCGDFLQYFPEAVSFSRKTFRAPRATDADVIISNTYPNDLSLTFAKAKGFIPFKDCRPHATRIAIAACPEGIGLHNIFPFTYVSTAHRIRHILLRLSVMPLNEMFSKLTKALRQKISRFFHRKSMNSPAAPEDKKNIRRSIWLYRPGKHHTTLPEQLPGIKIATQWSQILQAIRSEQGYPKHLKVMIYPCAFLQFLEEK